jgi:hypothetical protein
MALFDTNSGLGGLLGNLGDYGFGLPTNTGGLVADPDREAINKRALLSGLISAGLTYAATPKNLNTGSALPYLGKAGLAGFNTSQDVVDRALNTAYRNKLVAGRDDGFTNINPLDVTPESLQLYIQGGKKDPSVLRKAVAEDKTKLPTSRQEFDLAATDPAYMKFLREKWDSENKALKAGIQAQESAYNIGAPQQSISVSAGGKTYYFKDQNSANLFRQKAGIK